MRYIPKRDPFLSWYGLMDLPDPEYDCAICGGPIWADEEIDFNEHGETCHAECVENGGNNEC